MTDIPSRFQYARLKLDWAKEHIAKFDAIWKFALESKLCSFRIERDTDGPHQTVRFEFDTIPAQVALALGDAVHNIRAPLDYALAEILGWKDTRQTFPIGEQRQELESSFRTETVVVCDSCGRTKKRGRNALIEETAPGIGDFIVNEIGAYRREGGWLWMLNRLDNTNKHRLITPCVIPHTVRGLVVGTSGGDDINFTIKDLTFTSVEGQTIDLIGLQFGNLEVKNYGEITADLFFNEPQILEIQSALPALLNFHQAVTETIDGIDKFLTKTNWTPAARVT